MPRAKGSSFGRRVWLWTHALCKEAILGRPRKKEARTEQLNLSLTPAEIRSVYDRAAALGLRPAHFARGVLLAARRPAAAATRAPDSDNVRRLIYGQLTRLGNNLNQLVRHLHRTGGRLPADLEPLLHDIRQIIARGYGDGP